MLKFHRDTFAMQNNAAVLTVVCILLCLAFNYTFPLHRNSSKWTFGLYKNESKVCNNPGRKSQKIIPNVQNTLKKKHSIHDSNQNFLSDEDLRQYEQLVIMKKYPFLDFKEIDQKYRPDKNTRQSLKFESGSNFQNDPSVCEEEGLNVEIINRGLSGFAIPPHLTKHVGVMDIKLKANSVKAGEDVPNDITKISKKSPPENILVGLKDDIKNYEKISSI